MVSFFLLVNYIKRRYCVLVYVSHFLLDGSAPRGSGVRTGHKNKYPAGILYPQAVNYLSSEPDIAKRKQLSSGRFEKLRAGLPMPGRYVGTRI